MKPINIIATFGALSLGLVGACGARHVPISGDPTPEPPRESAQNGSGVAPTTTVFATAQKPPIDAVLGSPTGDDDFKTNGAVPLGKEPPELSVDGWVGTTKPLLLRELSDRVVLVFFCALSDTRCDGAHREMLGMQTHYADRKDLVIIELFTDPAIDDEQERAVAQGIGAHNLPWAAGYGKQVDYARLRYGFPDIPAAYLIDSTGKTIWSGRIGVDKDTLPKALATVMAEPP